MTSWQLPGFKYIFNFLKDNNQVFDFTYEEKLVTGQCPRLNKSTKKKVFIRVGSCQAYIEETTLNHYSRAA